MNYGSYFLWLLWMGVSSTEAAVQRHVKGPYSKGKIMRHSEASQIHSVTIAIKQNNIDFIRTKVDDISDMTSPNYAKHFTWDEIATLITDSIRTSRVIDYFTSKGATFISQTKHGEYIKLGGTVALWNQVFRTTLVDVKVKGDETVVCSSEYYIHADLVDDIKAVFNIVQMPRPHRVGPKLNKVTNVASHPRMSKSTKDCGCASNELCFDGNCYFNTLAFLNRAYNISSNQVLDSGAVQMVYESFGQTFAPADLQDFQNFYNIPINPMSNWTSGLANDSVCIDTPDNCYESNLDVQYIMGIAQGAPTIYSYDYNIDGFVSWMNSVVNTDGLLPTVISISYVYIEADLGLDVIEAFDIEALKVTNCLICCHHLTTCYYFNNYVPCSWLHWV